RDIKVSVHLYVGASERLQHSPPDARPVICSVALGGPAPVSDTVLRIAWRKAAHVVICVGVQFLAILIEPGLFGVVMGVHVDDLGIPVRFLTRNIVATFENQDPLTGRGQVVGERSATRPGSNDDYVITIIGTDAN